MTCGNFRQFCMNLWTIPTQFDDCLTYYECMKYLVDQIEKILKPAVLNNAEGIDELKKLYEDLKAYVDTYFDSLDIQTEVNAKLDQMAQNGQLADIIAQYLKVQSVLAFNTVAELEAADNLVEGSFAKTFGRNALNDGYGEFYKIRAITSDDVIDGYKIVKIKSDNKIVAEIIKDAKIDTLNKKTGEIETKTNSNTQSIATINEKIKNIDLTELVIFGDSWTDKEVTDAIWTGLVAKATGLTLHNYAVNGAGITNIGTTTFAQQVERFRNDGSFDHNKVKYIVMFGGINDYLNNVTVTNLKNEIVRLIGILKTIAPNAKIIYGNNSMKVPTFKEAKYWLTLHRDLVANVMIPTYNNQGIFSQTLYSNAFHMNQRGQYYLAKNIVSTLEGSEIMTLAGSEVVTGDHGTAVINTCRYGQVVSYEVIFVCGRSGQDSIYLGDEEGIEYGDLKEGGNDYEGYIPKLGRQLNDQICYIDPNRLGFANSKPWVSGELYTFNTSLFMRI